MNTPIRLLIADDHELFRQGLKMMLQLEPDMEVVGEVGRASDLPAALAVTKPDMLLLDLQMERSALPDIASLAEGRRIVIVTSVSTKTEGAPWYKRWFSRPSPQTGASAAAKDGGTPAKTPITYHCDVCGFAAEIRGTVYDHIKSLHKDVLDRNGRIREQPQGEPPKSQ